MERNREYSLKRGSYLNLKFNASIVEASNHNGNSTLRSARDLAFGLQAG